MLRGTRKRGERGMHGDWAQLKWNGPWNEAKMGGSCVAPWSRSLGLIGPMER
ncbi:hypothetical protein P691DRAFT_800381 [Macrolepiota fuliginosa MF-IS2]|uniref:Uncharacterized protein n=1 Tax=Macrolepiota fuliginosa MF-IS2 TaxID=1400762 RepID=A0A9P5WZA8_9AGAR|nr:hypothetical protein P691DRAFT_801457 [Macrolepiota fuliginosa MF-IS2]KAF9441075.1 hypothetical protein P691DRAFT_800381 [Macrolepiota fuliginosa MF-IS2]